MASGRSTHEEKPGAPRADEADEATEEDAAEEAADAEEAEAAESGEEAEDVDEDGQATRIDGPGPAAFDREQRGRWLSALFVAVALIATVVSLLLIVEQRAWDPYRCETNEDCRGLKQCFEGQCVSPEVWERQHGPPASTAQEGSASGESEAAHEGEE